MRISLFDSVWGHHYIGSLVQRMYSSLLNCLRLVQLQHDPPNFGPLGKQLIRLPVTEEIIGAAPIRIAIDARVQ